MPVPVKAWACKFRCGRKTDTVKKRMVEHEERCRMNPDRRMRPDRPRYWWYETKNREAKIADISSGFSSKLCVVQNHKPIRLSVFECSSDFGEWLGPACPPKRVDRYAMDITRGEMFRIATGAYVEYVDVKEYLLNGGENG